MGGWSRMSAESLSNRNNIPRKLQHLVVVSVKLSHKGFSCIFDQVTQFVGNKSCLIM